MISKPTVDQLNAFFRAEFPQAKVLVEALGEGTARVRHSVGVAELRPGGTVSGPVMMATADVALYAAILGSIGLVPLEVWVQAAAAGLRIVELPVPLVYLDLARSFGGALDDAATRLAYYRTVLDRAEAAVALQAAATAP